MKAFKLFLYFLVLTTTLIAKEEPAASYKTKKSCTIQYNSKLIHFDPSDVLKNYFQIKNIAFCEALLHLYGKPQRGCLQNMIRLLAAVNCLKGQF